MNELDHPLTPAELAQMGALQAKLATTRVFDPDSETIIDVPTSEAKGYIDAGFRTGPDADMAAQEAGPMGQTAAGLLGLARGGTFGLSDFAVPKNLRTIQHHVEELNPVTKVGSEIAGNLASLGVAGAGGAALATAKGAAQFAGLSAAASRIIAGGVEGGAQAAQDAERNNHPLTAERFLQGVGMGLTINVLGEGGGQVLKRSVPAFQRKLGKLLRRASESGWLERLEGQSLDPFAPGLEMGNPTAEEVSALGDEARAAFGGLEPTPELPGPVSESSRAPLRPGSPMSEAPGKYKLGRGAITESLAQAEALPESASETLGRRAGELPMPMSEAESRAAWGQLDREAADAARMGEMEGMEGVADDLRGERDYYSRNRGLSESELGERAAKLTELGAPDEAFDKGFAALEGGATEAGDLSRPTFNGAYERPPPLPARGVGFKTPKARTKALSTLAKADIRAAAGEAIPEELPLPLPGELPFYPVEQQAFAPTKYGIKNDPGILKGIYSKGKDAGLLHMIPYVGPTLSATYATGNALLYAAQKGIVGALNHEQALNTILTRVLAPSMKLTGTVVKNLMQSTSPELSSVYLGGDVDEEYEAISQGTNTAASDPEMIENYYQERYGKMLRTQPELYGNIVAQSAKQHAYVASLIPKDPRDNIGMLDEPYDPPRTDKLKVIQAYKAVNDPYSILTSPTMEGVAAVQATHPETLQLIQRLLVAELSDPKKSKRLTPEQKANLSMVLQIPVSGVDTPEFIAGLQEMAAMNGAPPTPEQQGQGPGAGQPQPQAPSFNATQGSQFANALAAPSQLNGNGLDSLT